MKYLSLILLLLFSSCSKFVSMTDDTYYEELNQNSDSAAQVLFSHNINGETHPCGCRNFPLGGLIQVQAYMESTAKTENQIYLDTGDAFFESISVPDFIEKSSTFTANKIAESFDILGLKFFTPGDQDFALGEKFLVEVSKKHNFKFLITNSAIDMKIKHIKHAYIKSGKQNLFFLGITSPELISVKNRKLFTSPLAALKKELTLINEKYKKISNKKFILLSHSGIDSDRNLAKELPKLSWIIGAHSQSYLRFSEDVGTTQLAQVLSRNHYLGEIKIPNNPKGKEKYQLVEVRDELKELVKTPSSMQKWLEDYKVKLDKIYQNEGSGSLFNSETSNKLTTYISCSECHSKQVDFWQETAHSIAFTTLIDAKESNNPKCIGCHSLGFREEGGFNHFNKMVQSESSEFNHKDYWNQFIKENKIKHPVRKLPPKERKKIAKNWLKLDTEKQVIANHGNVQCLNCHSQSSEHPFDLNPDEQKDHMYESKCLSCHTADQSPEWYNKDPKGLATSLNDEYFAKKLKMVSCPKLEKD